MGEVLPFMLPRLDSVLTTKIRTCDTGFRIRRFVAAVGGFSYLLWLNGFPVWNALLIADGYGLFWVINGE